MGTVTDPVPERQPVETPQLHQNLGQGGPMALQAPIDRLTHHTLRAAVLEFRERERRRWFPYMLHVGTPGRDVVHVEETGRQVDAGLRADLVLAMVQQAANFTPRPFAWLTRPGGLTLHDDDVPWASSLRWVAAATGVPISLVVVTRQGWFDPDSEIRREWQRLRRHRTAATA